MGIRVLAVGKVKEKYLRQGLEEYAKRLGAYTKLDIEEVKDEPTPETASEKEAHAIRTKEGERLLAKVKANDYVYLLDIGGKSLSSENFAREIERRFTYGDSQLVFIIGGSLGVSDAVRKRADFRLSFGAMTFPHQLMRLILLEQIYRAYRINRGEPYHK